MKWKAENHRGEVRAVNTRLGRFKLTVHRHIHYAPDAWLASSGDLFSQKVLAAKDLEQAKKEALAMLKNTLEEALAQIEERGGNEQSN